MALSDKTFNREIARRFLVEMANHLEKAADAEALGDFEECEKEELVACLGAVTLVENVSMGALIMTGEKEPPAEGVKRSFWEEAFPAMHIKLKRMMDSQ